MNNGTIPLQIALKLLGNGGEIITTPFSYVATVSSIVWEGCTPVFVDIDPETLTIQPNQIESVITPRTTCILATHVFGNICHVEQIESIAKKHGLKVIYDAAHCFGVRYNGKSIFEFGDIATCSFHATKIFHSGEGGALFSTNEDLLLRAFRMHNFGHVTPESFDEVGINGKISELNAAMGICVLQDMDQIVAARQKVVEYYREKLSFAGFRTQR
jgi:dTDP-4-amino-4,6-dideoxygalactose transaminase